MIEVNEAGFVVRAFFSGPRKKIDRICKILGIRHYFDSLRGNGTLTICPSDLIRPEKLARAQTEWNK